MHVERAQGPDSITSDIQAVRKKVQEHCREETAADLPPTKRTNDEMAALANAGFKKEVETAVLMRNAPFFGAKSYWLHVLSGCGDAGFVVNYLKDQKIVPETSMYSKFLIDLMNDPRGLQWITETYASYEFNGSFESDLSVLEYLLEHDEIEWVKKKCEHLEINPSVQAGRVMIQDIHRKMGPDIARKLIERASYDISNDSQLFFAKWCLDFGYADIIIPKIKDQIGSVPGKTKWQLIERMAENGDAAWALQQAMATDDELFPADWRNVYLRALGTIASKGHASEILAHIEGKPILPSAMHHTGLYAGLIAGGEAERIKAEIEKTAALDIGRCHDTILALIERGDSEWVMNHWDTSSIGELVNASQWAEVFRAMIKKGVIQPIIGLLERFHGDTPTTASVFKALGESGDQHARAYLEKELVKLRERKNPYYPTVAAILGVKAEVLFEKDAVESMQEALEKRYIDARESLSRRLDEQFRNLNTYVTVPHLAIKTLYESYARLLQTLSPEETFFMHRIARACGICSREMERFAAYKTSKRSRTVMKIDKTGSELRIYAERIESGVQYTFVNDILTSSLQTWREAGDAGIPVAPILGSADESSGFSRVYSRYCGLTANATFALQNDTLNAIISEKIESIERMLEARSIEHGHTHGHNFTVEYVEKEYLAKHGVNSLPYSREHITFSPLEFMKNPAGYEVVVRLIDWDRASSPLHSEKRTSSSN